MGNLCIFCSDGNLPQHLENFLYHFNTCRPRITKKQLLILILKMQRNKAKTNHLNVVRNVLPINKDQLVSNTLHKNCETTGFH